MHSDPILDTGLDLIDQGRYMFILGPTKRPVANCDPCRAALDAGEHDREACPCLLCHGFYAATGDPDRFRAIRAAVPRGMLAVRTGAISDIVIIDIDPRHGGRIIQDLMPATRAAGTGSGGWHLWHWHPGVTIPNSASRIGPGIDVRGDGGYAVCPPSIHPRTGRPYRWSGNYPIREMPAALVEACLPARVATPMATETRSTSTKTTEGISDPDALLAAILARVEQAPEGARRVTLYGASRGVAKMVAAGAVSRNDAWSVLTAAGRDADQTDRDIRRAIEGGFRAEGVAA